MRLTNTIRNAFVRAAMQDVPEIDYQEQMRKLIQDDAVAQLPLKVRAIYSDASLRHFLNTNYAYRYGSVSVPCAKDGYSPSAKAAEEYKRMDSANDSQDEKRNALESKLRACALACTTRKALVDMLPEFEKYLPADDAAACRTLPVVANVVSDFAQAGWPKGAANKSKAKKAA
jgi:hypothetical protein